MRRKYQLVDDMREVDPPLSGRTRYRNPDGTFRCRKVLGIDPLLRHFAEDYYEQVRTIYASDAMFPPRLEAK